MSIAIAENDVLAPAASSSWRTWLLTGTRRRPIYRRRVRGAHKGLKRMLVEGMSNGVEGHNPWNSFSAAMVRQAVGEGVSSLPPRQKQLIKLAYFGNLSNREIAQSLGITLSSVERGLREAIARVSEHVERGRTAGRRVIYGVAMFLGGRWLGDAQRAVKLGTAIIVTASAGAILSAQPAAPAQVAHVHVGSVPPATSSQLYEPARNPVADVGHALPAAPNVSTALTPPVVAVPVKLAIPVQVPPVPVTSIVHGLLGA